MLLTIELTESQEAQLLAAAHDQDVEMPALAQRLVIEHLPPLGAPAVQSEQPTQATEAKRQAAIAMLQSWLEEGKSATPEQVRSAEEEVEELKRNLNANRRATGERPVFR